jgi:deazaflavin-dependent oxidoreductase (nitroreductase family)
MAERRDWNSKIIEEFRANAGKVGGPFVNTPLLLLHHSGARTGTVRVNPVAYQELPGGGFAVFASKGGAPTNPAWYHNLLANPDVTLEVGTEKFPARATVATGQERERLFAAQAALMPGFADYQRKTERTIPVVLLERSG